MFVCVQVKRLSTVAWNLSFNIALLEEKKLVSELIAELRTSVTALERCVIC